MYCYKKTFLFILCIYSFFFKPNAIAQNYKGAIGVRVGYGVGISGVYLLNKRNYSGLEFLARYGYHGLILNKPGANFQTLYVKHWPLGRSKNFTGYVGGGPSIGIGKQTNLSKIVYFAFGASPMAGIDYTTSELRVPIIFSLDYKPTFFIDFPLTGTTKKASFDFSYYEIALSVRVGLGK